MERIASILGQLSRTPVITHAQPNLLYSANPSGLAEFSSYLPFAHDAYIISTLIQRLSRDFIGICPNQPIQYQLRLSIIAPSNLETNTESYDLHTSTQAL